MFTPSVFDRLIGTIDYCPFAAMAGRCGQQKGPLWKAKGEPLYTPEERQRRDASAWTTVQGVLAPIQFLVFLVSLGLVLRFLATGEGLHAATISIVVKTFVLYTIMITGAIWEERCLRPLPVRPGVLLGRRVQHPGAGAAHRLSRRAVLGRAGAPADPHRARRVCHLCRQRHAVRSETARRAARASGDCAGARRHGDCPRE